MPAPPVPDAEVRQAATYYQQAINEGRVDVAAGHPVCTGMKSAVTRVQELGGWTANQAKRRVDEAKKAGYFVGAVRPDYTAPVLPPEDEDLDALMERREREQERQDTYREAAEWMRFEVHGDEPFALAFCGDPHIDVCDIRRLRQHVALIESTDRMWAIGLGDWLNGWTGKLRGEYAHQTITERQAYQLARWLLQKPIWWLLLLGNHDGQRWHGQGSPLRWMENAAPVPVQEWAAKFSISCGGRVWRVSAAHNFPGNSQYDKGFGVNKRALVTGAEADIFVAGDRHVFTLREDQHEFTGRPYWAVRARGYKPLDHYALEHGHGDAGGRNGKGHSIGAVFDPRDGTVVCFSDLQKAVDFLATLRGKPRVRVAAGKAA
jgi:hypothetical protein